VADAKTKIRLNGSARSKSLQIVAAMAIFLSAAVDDLEPLV